MMLSSLCVVQAYKDGLEQTKENEKGPVQADKALVSPKQQSLTAPGLAAPVAQVTAFLFCCCKSCNCPKCPMSCCSNALKQHLLRISIKGVNLFRNSH